MCESEQQFCSHSQTHKKTEFLCSSTDPPIISNSNLIPYTYNTILNEEGANKKKWLNIFNKVYFNSSQENRAHPQITRNKHYNNQSYEYCKQHPNFECENRKGSPGWIMSACVCYVRCLAGGALCCVCSCSTLSFIERNHTHTNILGSHRNY